LHPGVGLLEAVLMMMLGQLQWPLSQKESVKETLMLFIPVMDSQGSASCIANRGSAFVVKLSLLEAFSWLVS
jgi:hypothetical protein